MADVPADPTPETIFVSYDTLRLFKASKVRRRDKKGVGWDFFFRLCSGGTLHKRGENMSGWAVDAAEIGRCVVACGAAARTSR